MLATAPPVPLAPVLLLLLLLLLVCSSLTGVPQAALAVGLGGGALPQPLTLLLPLAAVADEPGPPAVVEEEGGPQAEVPALPPVPPPLVMVSAPPRSPRRRSMPHPERERDGAMEEPEVVGTVDGANEGVEEEDEGEVVGAGRAEETLAWKILSWDEVITEAEINLSPRESEVLVASVGETATATAVSAACKGDNFEMSVACQNNMAALGLRMYVVHINYCVVSF